MDVVPILLVLPVLMVIAQDDRVGIIEPARAHDLHACAGTTAYIPWPLNIVTNKHYSTSTLTLSYKRKFGERTDLIATFNSRKEFHTQKPFHDRLKVSNEFSGIFLEEVNIDDAGTYLAQARMSDGQLWTRTTNLTVHIRPIVASGHLNMSRSELENSGRKNCVTLTCGTLEYAGYPSASFIWKASGNTLPAHNADDHSSSSTKICSPFIGEVTCLLSGFSSVCTLDHMTSLHIDLPGPPTNRSSTQGAMMTHSLLLIITMPILAVALPVGIIGIWVLSHVFKSYPQYREHRHYENDVKEQKRMSTAIFLDDDDQSSTSREGPPPVDIEADAVGDHVQANRDGESSREREDEVKREREKEESDADDNDGRDNDDDDADCTDDENKANEEQPLMEPTADMVGSITSSA